MPSILTTHTLIYFFFHYFNINLNIYYITATIGYSQAIKCYYCIDCETPTGERDCSDIATQCMKTTVKGKGM